jgi:protein-S-isoprenylcysteine O-methyltransferase Ste14
MGSGPRRYGILILFGMPGLTLLVYYLWLCVHQHRGALFVPTLANFTIPAPTLDAVVIFSVWLAFQAILQIVVPGKRQEGTPLADGRRLSYPMNGWVSFCITLGVFFLAIRMNWIKPTIIYDQFGPLLTTINLFAFGFSLFLYFFGKLGKGPERPTGNFFYDYFMGINLNPRIGSFDLKFFFESRPGLLGWVLVNYSLAAQQREINNGIITTPMCLVFAFQFLYVADYFWHEEAILTTWDIKNEKFGWMLVWGDLVWVPFTYTLQAYYLLRHPHDLPWWASAAIVILNLLGYAIFRGANWQKHSFRKDPEGLVWGKKPEYIQTKRGSLLLTSGWWGIARHINYLGDLMMALAWCLPCGFEQPLPYFYFIYFLILLWHRERRDHAYCLARYGADWEIYCRKVPWRIVPYVY